jgi:SPP1 family predicted phage head-tail adaptor
MPRALRYEVGRFRYKVALEQLVGTQDTNGQMVQTWQTWGTIQCSVEARTGAERTVGQELYASVNIIMRTRYQDGILPQMRATWGTRHFNIQAVLDEDGRRRFLTLLCVERVETGTPGE